MNISTFLVLLCLTTAVLAQNSQNFEEWKARCGRAYADLSEENYRRGVFEENEAEIERVNSQDLGYTLKANCKFGDRTAEEKQAELKGRQGRDIPSDSLVTRLRASVGLPVSVDWRDEGGVSGVRNQGTCGSCWAFSTAAIYESIVMIAGLGEYDLSEEYILECTTVLNNPSGMSSSCSGGIVDDSIPLAVQYGMPEESTFPYISSSYGSNAGFSSTPDICDISDTSSWIKENIEGVYAYYRDISHDEMKDLIAFAPIVALIYADSGFMNLGSGVYSGCPDYSTSKSSINHAVLIVGYDQNGNYIVKNSWDTTWGVDGFGVVSKDADCALAAYVYEIRGTNEQLQSEFMLGSLFIGVMFLLSFLMI